MAARVAKAQPKLPAGLKPFLSRAAAGHALATTKIAIGDNWTGRGYATEQSVIVGSNGMCDQVRYQPGTGYYRLVFDHSLLPDYLPIFHIHHLSEAAKREWALANGVEDYDQRPEWHLPINADPRVL